MTCFDVFHVLIVLAGLFLGGAAGYARFGTIGAVAGCVLGGILGFLAGRVPFALALGWTMRGFSRQSTERLRERLASQYYISHVILAELMSRGEDIRVDLPVILALLRSDLFDERRFGFHSLKLAFPEVASRLADYNPADSTESCREKVARIDRTA
jgi:hypothetical protein